MAGDHGDDNVNCAAARNVPDDREDDNADDRNDDDDADATTVPWIHFFPNIYFILFLYGEIRVPIYLAGTMEAFLFSMRRGFFFFFCVPP